MIHAVELVFLLLLLFVVVFATLARKLQTPYPIVLVIAGLLLSCIPGMPRISLSPDVVFLIVLPPLLFSAAYLTSWRDFKFHLVSILMLAFGLVGFTVVTVAATARWAFVGFGWRLGCVLGAVVATTDAIAATSIAKRLGLPQPIVDILEGESLVNDASGLLALELAVAMVVDGRTPTVSAVAVRMIFLIGVGLATGLAGGWIVKWIDQRIDDGPVEITLSIFTPYAVYLLAESLHASGVLAVVACGLYLSRQSAQFLSAGVRLQLSAVWNSLTFILNGLVFVMIGLQLPQVLAGIREYNTRQLLFYGAFFSVSVILLRLLWMFPGAHLAYFIRTRVLRQNYAVPNAREVFVIGWTGMRGVVALAAAIALPERVANGGPFPGRDLILFLTFSVILVTLVLQGLTLPSLIRALGLASAGGDGDEEEQARRIIASSVLAHLEEARSRDLPGFAGVYDNIARHYQLRLVSLTKESADGDSMSNKQLERYRAQLATVLQVERKTAVGLRNEGRINDEVLRKIERELDLSETRMVLN